MLFRNQASMDVEESIRSNPMDGVILLVGCDKTTPALLMGAASCDLPTIALSGGPMLNGRFRGGTLGSGTSVWKFTAQLKTGVGAGQKLSVVIEDDGPGVPEADRDRVLQRGARAEGRIGSS